MANIQHLTADIASERLDAFLARRLPHHSRSTWQKLCANGMIQVDNTPQKASYRLRVGETVLASESDVPNFTQFTLPIIYEDDDVLVINKPSGILTHAKGALSDEFTVAEFVRSRTTDGPETNRPGIVHRLDRATSGLLIAAKTPEAKRWLQKQFAERKVKKSYTALVEGHLKQSSATIDLPIARNPKKPQTFRVDANGKPAVTSYQTLQIFANHTLLSLQPLTGRTHQLRVHLKHLGHPIVGDELYGRAAPALGRLFLHAASLELTVPNRQRRVWHAPMPSELQKYLTSLHQ